MEERACAVCGASLTGRNVRAVYCQDACKKRRWRAEHRNEELAAKRERRRLWREANPVARRVRDVEARRRYKRGWAARNADRIKAQRATPEARHKDRMRSADRYRANRYAVLAQQREYRAAHKEEIADRDRRYRERNYQVVLERDRLKYWRNSERNRAVKRARYWKVRDQRLWANRLRYWGNPALAEAARVVYELKKEIANYGKR